MNRIFRLLILSALFSVLSMPRAAAQVYLDETQPIEARIDDALSRMTLEEKIAIIHAHSKFSAPGVKRLGIPDLWTDDGPHGVRPDVFWDDWGQAGHTNDSCVAFPALTCLAATWNTDVARLYGKSLGEEARYRGKHVILGPGVNIYRTPLGGRNFEYMGEDPFLASRMVVPYIQSLQSNGVAACVKHYALNNDEEYRHQVNVIVSDRALYEIYLPAFKAAVQEGGAWTLMAAYNLYQDQHNCHNARLLNDILKRDWKFDGVVVSDWGGCHNTEEAITNGLDLEMGSWTDGLSQGASNAYDMYFMAMPYKKLIREGKYTTKELDDKVRRLLRLHFRTTMDFSIHSHGSLCSDAHYDAARAIACEGIVLLKNDAVKTREKTAWNGKPVLPIAADVRRVLVVGENAIKMMTVGGGSSSLKAQREILPLDGIKAAFGADRVDYARGYVGDVTGSYDGVTSGQNLNDSRSADELIAEAVEKAKQADCVIFVGGLNKSDFQDCEGHDRKQYALPYDQDRVVEALVKANPRLVFVNISGNAVAMPWAQSVPAIVQGWFLGSQAGLALADVLTGRANPSGKLPFTWYNRLEDTGAHALDAFPGVWRDDKRIIDEEYKEGIYVGYRWADKQKITPLFAFGHGLSYTTFAVKNARIEANYNGTWTVTADVTNTGDRPGSEVLQLYIHDKKCSVDRPQKELKGFAKLALQPGETRTATITFDRDALSFYDEPNAKWTAEPGDFEAWLGTSAANIQARLKFTL